MTTERGMVGFNLATFYTAIDPGSVFGGENVYVVNDQTPGTDSWTYSWEFPTKWSNLRKYFEAIPNFDANEVIDYLEQNNQSLEDHLDTAFLKTCGGVVQGQTIFASRVDIGGYSGTVEYHYISGITNFQRSTSSSNGMWFDDVFNIYGLSYGFALHSYTAIDLPGYVLLSDENGATSLNTGTSLNLNFQQGNSTKARIDTSGNFVALNNIECQGILWQDSSLSTISTTTTVNTTGWNMNSSIYRHAGPGAIWALNCTTTGTASTNVMVLRRLGTACGYVSVTGNTANWGTTSDYRRKNELGPISDAVQKLLLLRPVEFEWKEFKDSYISQGFIAHEVQEIVPQAVAGEKDAVDEEGNPSYQMVDYGKIVPLLVAAIQELEQRVRQLEEQNA